MAISPDRQPAADRAGPLRLPALLILAGLTGYTVWFPLFPYAAIAPTRDVYTLAPSLAAGLAYALLLTVLFGLLVWAARLAACRPPRLAALLLTGGLFCLPLLAAYPINANDLFRYFSRGRISAVHAANPYVQPATAFPDDPFLPLAGEWAGETSPYGPVWEIVAAGVSWLAGNQLLLALILFKLLAAAAHLASAALVWRLLANQPAGERAARTLLWAWNPGLLLYFVADGHNDALLLLWLLAGWSWLAAGRRPAAGFGLLGLGALTKPIGLLALPFIGLWAWRRAGNGRLTLRAGLSVGLPAGASLLLLAALAFIPFGSPVDLIRRLLAEASTGASFSSVALLVLAGRAAGLAPDLATLARLLTLLFLAFAGWLLWRTAIGRSPVRAVVATFAGYVLQAQNFRIWYATWLYPWALVAGSEAGGVGEKRPFTRDPYLAATLTFLWTTHLSVVIYGHLRLHALGGSQTLAHALGVPLTFGLPLVVGWLAQRGGTGRRLPEITG